LECPTWTNKTYAEELKKAFKKIFKEIMGEKSFYKNWIQKFINSEKR